MLYLKKLWGLLFLKSFRDSLSHGTGTSGTSSSLLVIAHVIMLAGCSEGLDLGSGNSPPEFGALDVFRVGENDLTVGSVAAVDPDNDTINYSVLGSDGSSFQIDDSDGMLTFVESPDFENPADFDGDNAYQLIVRASDARQSTDIAIEVVVKDQEEINLGPYLPLDIAEHDYQNFTEFDTSNVSIDEVFTTPDRLWSLKIHENRLVIASSVNGLFYVHDLQSEATTELDMNTVIPLYNNGQGGIFDFEIVSNPGSTVRLYFAASISSEEGAALSVHSFALNVATETAEMSDYRKHFELPASDSLYHFGGALKVVDRTMYVSHGDRLERSKAQSSTDHNGKVLRLIILENGDLEAHPENDFLPELPLVFSMGHRNPQGMEWIDFTQMLISTEHGPQGGDEVNVLVEKKNYGWPRATFGEEYGGGIIGQNQVEGLQDAVTYYLPSIAPRAIRYVGSSAAFPTLGNSLLIASLKFERIIALRLDSERPSQSYFDLSGEGRISGLDLNDGGEIFVATHSIPGRVLKLSKN